MARTLLKSIAFTILAAGVLWVLGDTRERPEPIELEAADALEFYSTSTNDLINFTSATYGRYLAITVDRTSETENKDFFVLATLSITVSSTTAAESAARLLAVSGAGAGATSTLSETESDFRHQSTSTFGRTFNVVKQVTIATTTPSTFVLEVANVTAGENVEARVGRIIILEKSAGAEYTERTTDVGTGANTGYVDALTLTFTPGTQDDYLFFWSAEKRAEDDDAAGVLGVQFINTTDTVAYAIENDTSTLSGTNAQNDNKYYTAGGAVFDTVEASSHSFTIQMDGEGTADEVYVRRAAIAAIPFSDFESVATTSTTTATVGITSSAPVSIGTAVEVSLAADTNYLAITGYECGNGTPTGSCVSALEVFYRGAAGSPIGTHMGGRDSDNDHYYLAFLAEGVSTTTATTTEFELLGARAQAIGLAVFRSRYLFVGEIPTSTPNVAPTITDINLNGGANITLIESSFVIASTTISITDTNGCSEINYVDAKLYKGAETSGGTVCTPNDNTCYNEFIACTATTTGNTCTGGADTSVDYDCGFRLWWIADPTDTGSPDASLIWIVAATTSDGLATTTATNTDQLVDVNTLLAFNTAATIPYGTLNPGQNTGAFNATTTISNSGNATLDIEVSGDVMCTDYPTCAGAANTRIAPTQQHYASTTFAYSSGAGGDFQKILPATTSSAEIGFNISSLAATTSLVSGTPISWGIGVPLGRAASSYIGQNVLTAIVP